METYLISCTDVEDATAEFANVNGIITIENLGSSFLLVSGHSRVIENAPQSYSNVEYVEQTNRDRF